MIGRLDDCSAGTEKSQPPPRWFNHPIMQLSIDWIARENDPDDVPVPPDHPPDAPVEEPPDAPHSEPKAPVREPGPEPQRRLERLSPDACLASRDPALA